MKGVEGVVTFYVIERSASCIRLFWKRAYYTNNNDHMCTSFYCTKKFNWNRNVLWKKTVIPHITIVITITTITAFIVYTYAHICMQVTLLKEIIFECLSFVLNCKLVSCCGILIVAFVDIRVCVYTCLHT